MFTHLVKKPNYYICGNCRMKQHKLHETCWFCGYFFSNYENIILKNYMEQVDPEIPEVEVDFISDDE